RAGPGWPDLLTRVPQVLAHQVVFFSELRRDELAECEATRQPHNAERYLVAVVRAAATKGVATTMTSQDRPGQRDPGDLGLDAIMSERRQLMNLAYRLLGSLAEAEDAVQEAYARWYAMSRPEQDA